MAKLFLLLIGITLCGALQRQDLGGQWSVTGGIDKKIDISATVPGGIFSDLMDSGEIADILYGRGDSDYAWVGLSAWNYSSSFSVNKELLDHESVSIVFEGLDTFAAISINGKVVGEAENMFRRYVFDVKDILKEGSNDILVAFASSVNESKRLGDEQDTRYAILPECPDSSYHGICHANMIRKMQASFSWDWGPAFASVGIWKEVYLEAVNTAVVDYVVATPTKDPKQDNWVLEVSAYLNTRDAKKVAGTVTANLQLNDKNITASADAPDAESKSSEIKVTLSLEVSENDIQLWWPNGYGEQKLYNLTVTFEGEEEQDEKKVKVGFRTVELIQDKLEKGLTFYFKINGFPIFVKGANEIPIDILPEKGQNRTLVKKLLQDARDVHMNVLRVWGGGVYESQDFYDLTDEYGILIWQDFMFACAMYPTTDEFLDNVAEEIRHQLKRLGTHPSIALWAGNNENEAALIQNWYGTGRNLSLYKEDYIKLYVDVIQPVVTEILPHAVYVTSSPSNGQETVDEGYLASNPGDTFYGDVHFYDYGADTWSLSTFPIPRFASEYGYQSLPSWDAWLTTTSNLSELNIDSSFLTYRQHHPGGQSQNVALIKQQLNLPETTGEPYSKTFIYFSQVLQAQAYKVETENYRSFKGRLNEKFQGYTMGALYWQLNDVWVAPTWSGIDFTGKWKILHYQARNFLSPLIITGRLNDDKGLELYAVLDALEVPANKTVKALLQIVNWESLTPLVSVEFPVTLDPQKAVLITTISAVTALYTAGCGSSFDVAKTKCLFHFHLLDQDNVNLSPSNYFFLDRLKNSNLQNANVTLDSITSVDTEGKVYDILLKTDAVALFVWLDAHHIAGRFSDNGFLQPHDERTVTFTADEPTTLEAFKAALTITHLKDPANI